MKPTGFLLLLAALLPVAGDISAKCLPAVAVQQSLAGEFDKAPSFRGGDADSFRKWIMGRVKPAKDDGVIKRVEYRFTVNKNGWVVDIELLRSDNKAISDKILAELDRSPKWTPATKDGQAVPATFDMSFVFGPDAELEALDSGKAEAPGPGEAGVVDYESLPDDDKPTFKGDNLEVFKRWVYARLTYPPQAVADKISGIVSVRFIIGKDGNLSGFSATQTPGKLLSDEAIRVIRNSPKWTPGKVDGKSASVAATININFQMK